MLLSEFRKIQEIDQKLNELHNERIKLFNAEAAMFQTSQMSFAPQEAMTASSPSKINPNERWTQQKYAELLTKWQTQGLKIPALSHLRDQLERAQDLLEEVSIIKPELYDKMSIVLVPPNKEIEYSSAAHTSKNRKRLHLSQEFLDAKFSKQKIRKTWRVIIAFSESEGLYIGTPHQLLSKKRYLIGSYDAYVLGADEYSALVQQEAATKFDTETSTALLRDGTAKNDLVPLVKFSGKSYTFGAETAITPFGDIRFRPAIEI